MDNVNGAGIIVGGGGRIACFNSAESECDIKKVTTKVGIPPMKNEKPVIEGQCLKYLCCATRIRSSLLPLE